MINQQLIADRFLSIMSDGLGLDISDPNLVDTPERIAKMYSEFFYGVHGKLDDLKVFPNEKNTNQIILLDNIHFVSHCSHHFLPFSGLAWVAYIPDKKLMGASKPARVISHLGSKPHLQENLCEEVANYLYEEAEPKAILVAMRAVHGCMKHRGIKQYNGAGMFTSAIRGGFLSDPTAKAEAWDMIKMSIQI